MAIGGFGPIPGSSMQERRRQRRDAPATAAVPHRRTRAWRGPPRGGTLLAVSSLTAAWIRFHSHPEGPRRVIAIAFTPDIHLIYTAQG